MCRLAVQHPCNPLSQCAPKPEGDKYGFTHFARASNSGRGVQPLPSDSRRRPDRKALEASAHTGAVWSVMLVSLSGSHCELEWLTMFRY